MNTDMKARVTKLLEDYSSQQRKIGALHYELVHPTQISGDEQIGAMTYSHGTSEGMPSAGYVSNKTLYIALNYHSDRIYKTQEAKFAAVVDDIAEQLVNLEQKQDRLKYYVSLLEKRQAEVIRRSYFEEEPQEDIAKALRISVRTVQKIKSQAIDALVEIYSLTGRLD